MKPSNEVEHPPQFKMSDGTRCGGWRDVKVVRVLGTFAYKSGALETFFDKPKCKSMDQWDHLCIKLLLHRRYWCHHVSSSLCNGRPNNHPLVERYLRNRAGLGFLGRDETGWKDCYRNPDVSGWLKARWWKEGTLATSGRSYPCWSRMFGALSSIVAPFAPSLRVCGIE